MDQSNQRLEFFPDDVILQILARLPVKALTRIKCVCKLWYQLASGDYFRHVHNELSIRNPMVLVEVTDTSSESRSSLICVDNLRGVYEFSLDFIKARVKVRASCNGLLCCSSIPDKGVYYVCNPMTREYKMLPRSRERPVTRFYPDGEATLVGLACNLLTHNYNVVLAGYHRPFGHRPERTFICLVYDSESNKWRKFVSLQDDHFTHMNRNQVVFINGSLHWLTGSCTCLLVLDLECDMWRRILLPNEVNCAVGNRAYLLESEGCLSVIQISEAWMNIWVMKDYEREEWHMVDKVSLRCIRGMVPGIFPISQTGEYVFLATHKQVLVYQLKNKVWKEMYSVKNSSTLPLCMISWLMIISNPLPGLATPILLLGLVSCCSSLSSLV
ncbi:F-box protein At5g49610 isoform X2 [Coffea arabica]|uniref:F-box protein At5g49610 isoform X2 n=1 Tax=Coffea arabica TaxID=13443 RepID=A0A6P6WQK3_COFAR|nr:F-box protein At5g49610-like isoform X2 [Coffea arabica]